MSTAAADAPQLDVVAVSHAMRELLKVVKRLGGARSAVLLQGESGTGKDLIAHLMHYAGDRRQGPLIKVHCPSIPEDLLESELFGHEKGAFTDAASAKIGKIEMANGGSLYFDQVQDLSLALQAKLLRVVEELRFERLGGTRTISVDVRFISSANVDLREAVHDGGFREDLYHRLSVVPLEVPALRDRREDIPPLARHFLERTHDRHATPAHRIDDPAMDVLRGYAWPGNVRELRGAIERASLYASSEIITVDCLPRQVMDAPEALWRGRDRHPSLREVEEAYIRHVLAEAGGSQTLAASILGISRKSLWERRRRFGIP